jgi:intracellular septation protein A
MTRIRLLLPTLLLDLVLPIGGYYLLKHLGASDWVALAAGGAVSGVVMVAGIVRGREVDGPAAFMLGLFAFGLLTLFLTGDARFVLAKDSILSAAVGLVFLGSLVGKRPLLLVFVAKTAPNMAQLYEESPALRRTFRVATILWGVGMLVEAASRVLLVYTLPVDVMVIGSPALTFLVLGVLVVLTRTYAQRQHD